MTTPPAHLTDQAVSPPRRRDPTTTTPGAMPIDRWLQGWGKRMSTRARPCSANVPCQSVTLLVTLIHAIDPTREKYDVSSRIDLDCYAEQASVERYRSLQRSCRGRRATSPCPSILSVSLFCPETNAMNQGYEETHGGVGRGQGFGRSTVATNLYEYCTMYSIRQSVS